MEDKDLFILQKVNIVAEDDLATQGARSSTAMLLT